MNPLTPIVETLLVAFPWVDPDDPLELLKDDEVVVLRPSPNIVVEISLDPFHRFRIQWGGASVDRHHPSDVETNPDDVPWFVSAFLPRLLERPEANEPVFAAVHLENCVHIPNFLKDQTPGGDRTFPPHNTWLLSPSLRAAAPITSTKNRWSQGPWTPTFGRALALSGSSIPVPPAFATVAGQTAVALRQPIKKSPKDREIWP